MTPVKLPHCSAGPRGQKVRRKRYTVAKAVFGGSKETFLLKAQTSIVDVSGLRVKQVGVHAPLHVHGFGFRV